MKKGGGTGEISSQKGRLIRKEGRKGGTIKKNLLQMKDWRKGEGLKNRLHPQQGKWSFQIGHLSFF